MIPYSINVRGRLLDLSEPLAMGVLNVTPDSFYEGGRQQTDEAIRRRVRQIVDEGGRMIDIGACSTRPGAGYVSEDEEMRRLAAGMRIVREEAPDVAVSVDTFRADVARMAVEELGADIVNDVTGGQGDGRMFTTVARMGVPYVLTHCADVKLNSISVLDASTGDSAAKSTEANSIMKVVLLYFAERIQRLRDLGQKDIILDPGYGFGKTLEQNHALLANQDALRVFDLPLLVGVSRKSMIYKLLDCTPQEALNGTTVLNTIALQRGASILRVHDVREAVETIKLATFNIQLSQQCSTSE